MSCNCCAPMALSCCVCLCSIPFPNQKARSLGLSMNSAEHDGVCVLQLLCCNGSLLLCLPVQYSIPKPKGGRHANNPFTVPDQKVTYCQPKKRESRLDVFSPDYTSLSSPFVAHDVTSRGANMAFAKGGLAKPRNPNEVRRKGKRRR